MADQNERAKADFASKKFCWIETLCMDPRVTSYQKTAGIILLSMVNRSTGYAWPSMETLGELSGATKKAARDMTTRLEALGYFRITRETGSGNTNKFWPIWVGGSSPVTDAARALRIAKKGRADESKRSPHGESFLACHSASKQEKGSPSTPKGSPTGDCPTHRRVTRTLKMNPDKEPSSETNVSAVAGAPRLWDGGDQSLFRQASQLLTELWIDGEITPRECIQRFKAADLDLAPTDPDGRSRLLREFVTELVDRLPSDVQRARNYRRDQ